MLGANGDGLFHSLYLAELSGTFIVPGYSELSVEQLRMQFDLAFAGSTGRTVNGVDHFSALGAATSWGFARTPVLNFGEDEAFRVVPVQRNGELAHLVIGAWKMRYSDEQAHIRGALLERIAAETITPIRIDRAWRHRASRN